MKTNTTKEINFTLNDTEAREVHRALTVEKDDPNFDHYRGRARELTNQLARFIDSNKR